MGYELASDVEADFGNHGLNMRVIFTIILLLTFGARAETGPAEVQFQEHGHGWLLIDANGMSLYTYVRDIEPNKSRCNDACAEQWPPLAASSDDRPTGDWAPFARDDGTYQWAYQGGPLYTYARDVSPGDSYGDGFRQQWFAALKPIETPASISISKTLLGYVVADRKKMTLYTIPVATDCGLKCTQMWKPLSGPWMANDRGDWSVVARPDGGKQWAYRGQPLYRYEGDVKPRETSGNGKDGFNAIVLEPPPSRPAWVTVIAGDAGVILGNANKKTLYARIPPRPRRVASAPAAPDAKSDAKPAERRNEIISQVVGRAPESESSKRCGIECPGTVWEPVIMAENDEPVGNWSLVERPDGRTQWAYKGNLLYINSRDAMSGDLEGIRAGAGRNMQPLTPSGEQMPGTGA